MGKAPEALEGRNYLNNLFLHKSLKHYAGKVTLSPIAVLLLNFTCVIDKIFIKFKQWQP